MPFRLFSSSNSSSKLSRKKTYNVSQNTDESMQLRPRSTTLGTKLDRRHSSPVVSVQTVGILKRSGRSRPIAFPCLTEPGMLPQEMAAAVPMPSETELNLMFAQLVDELGLNRELMFKLPLHTKWELYLSKQKEQQSIMGTDPQPEFYIDKIVNLTALLYNATEEAADSESNLLIINELKTALRTQPINFVLRFIDQNGLEQFLNFLQNMNVDVRQSQLHYSVVGCIKALMNNAEGRGHVLAHPRGIVVIAQSIRTVNLKTKILALEILGALCLVPGGHKKVLGAMDNFQRFGMEGARFQTLMLDLTRTLDDKQDAANLQIAILSFINVIINYKAGEESLEFRMHLRHEFLALGILPVISRLRALSIAQLNKHLEIFELVRLEDERELSTRLDSVNIDYNSLSSMIELLRKKTAHTLAHSHLFSIVYHCLLLPIDDPLYGKYWHLIDRLVQQVVIQQQQGVDPDIAPVAIDVNKLVKKLAKEDELHGLRLEVSETRKERDDYRFKLRKKEWECESRMMECDQFRGYYEKIKVKLNRKASELSEAWNREQEVIDKNSQLQSKIEVYREHIHQLEVALKEGNIGQLPTLPSLKPATPAPPPPPPPPPSLPAAPPPPPPPVPAGAPLPPALPTLNGSPGHAPNIPEGVQLRNKCIPKPSQALKSLNWKKLPANQITQNSVWKTLDDSRIHAVLDLTEFEQTFSVYRRRESGLAMPQRQSRTSLLLNDKAKELSVIEGRRAQNCTIMLSKIKMSDSEIKEAILTMDRADRLNKDTLELMVKYVPTSSEMELLESHAQESETFARADKFLLGMSRIPQYGERLKSLYFMKTRDDRLNELRPNVQDILLGCKELQSSQKLSKVLEIVLAFGNFMNRGNMGNAAGFRLASLNKIVDTKSSSSEGMTLLHYLVKTLKAKFQDVLTLESELPHVKNASKVDIKEVEKEFADLKFELQEIQRELTRQKKQNQCIDGDLFVPTMERFVGETKKELNGLQSLILAMKTQLEETLTYFGEDLTSASCPSTDEFFGIFTTFFASFSDANNELIAAEKKKEDAVKRKKELEKQREMTLKRRRSRLILESNAATSKRASASDCELDDLIAVLKTGDYFSHRKARPGSATTRKVLINRDRPTSITNMPEFESVAD